MNSCVLCVFAPRYGVVLDQDYPVRTQVAACPSSLLVKGPTERYPKVIKASEPSVSIAYGGSSALGLMQVSPCMHARAHAAACVQMLRCMRAVR